MPRSRWTVEEDEPCLVCRGDVTWPSADSARLFVMPCYESLFGECQALIDGGIQGIFLKGTPGIGKSCFLDYALHRFLQQEKTVLYAHGRRNYVYKFYPPRAGSGFERSHGVAKSLIELELASNDDVDVVLFDPHEDSAKTQDYEKSHFFGKPFVVAVSPDPENCKALLKTAAQSMACLYMGPLSPNEAEEMREACYTSSVSRQLVSSRYKVMGGLPRYLFAKLLPNGFDSALDQVKQKQEKALREAVDQPQVIDGGDVDANFKHLWSLYFLKPLSANSTVDHYRYTIEICGDDARARLRDRLMEKDVKDLWNLYENTLAQNGSLRGIRFEAYAHKKILTEGVNGIAVSLTQSGTGTTTAHVTIPASLPKIILPNNNLGQPFVDGVEEARGRTSGGYILPYLSNFPVLDSAFVSRSGTIPIQMKEGRSKSLSRNAGTLFTALSCHDLFFIVPDDLAVQRKLAGGPARLKQYRLVLKED